MPPFLWYVAASRNSVDRMPWLDTGWKPHVGVKCSGHCMGCVRPICFIVFCWKLMFCVFSGKKKKSHPEIISSPMGMTFKKKHPIFWALSKLRGEPPAQTDFSTFWKVKKLPTLACSEGTWVFFLEVSWGPNLQSSLWRLPNHKKTKQMFVFQFAKKKLKSGSMHRTLTVWLPDEKLVGRGGKEGTSTTFG